MDFDISRGLGVDFELKKVEFRDGADGPILAGLDGLRIDGARIEPASGSVRVKSIEIAKPAGRVVREKDGSTSSASS